MRLIRNVLLADREPAESADVLIENGKILSILPAGQYAGSAEVTDGTGLYACPGFIDHHAHGGDGADVMDCTEEAVERVCEFHLKHGTTTFYPTTSTDSVGSVRKVIAITGSLQKKRADRQYIPGVHIEGQYIAAERDGGMYKKYIKSPDPEEYLPLLEESGGLIKRWSIAPELPGALEFGDACTAHGVVCSLAHSNATYDDVVRASRHGFRHMTHFYSDMNTVTRVNGFRVPGAIEAGYDLEDQWIEVIGDGCHIPPALLRYMYRHIGPERMHLVSDSVRCAGTGKEGDIIDVGSRDRELQGIIEDGVVKFMDRSAFHGSIASGIDLLRAAWKKTGLPLADCVKMLTENPARIMGIDSFKGRLAPGFDADIVLFDGDCVLHEVIYNGRTVSAGL